MGSHWIWMILQGGAARGQAEAEGMIHVSSILFLCFPLQLLLCVPKDQQSPRLGSPNPLNRSGHGSHLLKCSSLCHFHHGFLYRVSSHSLLSPYFSSANSLKHVIHWPIWFTSSLGVYVSCHFHNILRDERSHLCVCCCCFGLRVMIC